MAKMGRPIKEVDLEKLARVCQYPMTNEDIAAILDVSVDTVSRVVKENFGITFAEYKDQKQSNLRFTLLAKQIDVAKSGNVSMLIWLGKQYLGQKDHHDVDLKASQIKIVIDKEDSKL